MDANIDSVAELVSFSNLSIISTIVFFYLLKIIRMLDDIKIRYKSDKIKMVAINTSKKIHMIVLIVTII